jgi:hypothetical protein
MTAAWPQVRVGVEEVRRAVEGDDGLARARAAVHHERTPGGAPDDRVLVRLDGPEHVPHPRRPARAQARQERRVLVEGGGTVEPVGVEHLVPVVGDAAVGPAVPTPAEQPARVGGGGGEERLGRGGAPVDEQAASGGVGEAEAPDVHHVAVGGEHATEADVEAEPAQRPEAGGQPVDLLVALERRLAAAARGAAGGVQAVGRRGDGLLEGGGEGREERLVVGDQARVGLGGAACIEGERAGGGGVHGTAPVGGRAGGGAVGRGEDGGAPVGCGRTRRTGESVDGEGGLAARPRSRYTLNTAGRERCPAVVVPPTPTPTPRSATARPGGCRARGRPSSPTRASRGPAAARTELARA